MREGIEILKCPGKASETVTVLTVGKGNSATKTFRWNGTEYIKIHAYGAGMWFSHEAHAVSNIHDLSELLTAVEASQDSFIIRGELGKDTPSRDRVRRMKRPDDNGVTWFTEQPRHWLCIDIDDVGLPAWADPVTDPVRIAKYLIDLLPECFHGVTCHWQMSSSAGVKPATEAKAHLWFWLDRPVGEAELKRWKDDFDVKIDSMVFGTVQPLFVARPIFVDGPDPLPRRSGLLVADHDAVAVPEIDMSIVATPRTDSAGYQLEAAAGYENKLALLGDDDGLEGFHAPITSAVAAYVVEHGARFDAEELKGDLRRRIDAAPRNRGRDADVKRYKSDAYLDPSIQGAVERFGAPKIVPATYQIPDGGLDDARDQQRQTMKAWSDRTHTYTGDRRRHEARRRGANLTNRWQRMNFALVNQLPTIPVYGIEASTGIGKSHEMRLTVRDLLPSVEPGHCAFVAVPNHRLAEETVAAFQALGVEAAVYRGLSALDPKIPGAKMCQIAPDAEVLRRGGSTLSKLCDGCPHASVCGWQRQLLLKAQVWVGTHNLLFHPRRQPIPPIDIVVIDESPVAMALEGFSDEDMISVSANELRHRAENGNDELREWRNELADMIASGPVGEPLKAGDLPMPARFDAKEVARLVYGENEDVLVHGAMTTKARKAAIEIAKRNRRRLVEAKIWEAIGGPSLAGLRIEEHSNTDGIPERRLRLRRRREVHSDFGCPTLLLDATPQWDVYEQFWDINSITKVEAGQPHVTVRQITWSASKAKLLAETGTAKNNCGRMLRYIEGRASKCKRLLVLCQKDLEDWLRERLPENVEIGHFNAVRGLDRWKDVDCLVLIGRTQPPPREMEMQAEVIFGEFPFSLGNSYYPRDDAGLSVTDEAMDNCVQREFHPDDNSEMLRWLVCEAELIQCLGRARGVIRTADNPLQIDIIGTVPLPIAVDEVMSLAEATPDPLDVVAGRGVVLDCDPSTKGAAKVVSAILPDLFGSSDAVRSARRRSPCQTPNKNSLLGKRHSEEILRKNWPASRLRLPENRYAVPIKARRRLWRVLRDGEKPPAGARLARLGENVFVLEPLIPEEFRANAGYILRK